jgi:hypothetical protein
MTVVFALFGGCFLCCVLCYKQSLKLAIDVIDASADFLKKTKRIILVSVLFFTISLISVFVWIGAQGMVLSLNHIKASTIVPQQKDIDFSEKKYFYMALYMLFGLLWIQAFLEYACRFIVMVAASTYYFNSTIEDGEDGGEADVSVGFKYALVHSGSIALGSFIIAVVQMIRIVFMYVAQKAKEASGDNQVVKLVICIGDCLIRCLEKIVDYLNHNAYAYMAVSGQSFCASAWDAFLLNLRHLAKFSFAQTLASMFILAGKFTISVSSCVSLFFIMKHVTKDMEEITSLAGPMIVVFIMSLLTASVFIGLLDTVATAMLYCLAIDMDLNGGVPAKGPKTFHDSIDKVKSKSGAKVDDVEKAEYQAPGANQIN